MTQLSLSELLAPWNLSIDTSIASLKITGLSHDSRQLQPGDLFVVTASSLDYVPQAERMGAIALLYDLPSAPKSILPCIYFPNVLSELGKIAARFYHDASQGLKVTAVTGTNGKTTVAYLLAQAFDLLGQKSAYCGTLGVGDIHHLKETGMTTPAAIDLQKYCHQFRQQGVVQLAIEASSHGLNQHRLAGLDIEYAVFTNLTHDHLDYHKTFEDYAAAKAQLFAWNSLKAAVLNKDCPWHSLMLKDHSSPPKVVTYAVTQEADVYAKNIYWTLDGLQMDIVSPWGACCIHSKLLGHFNVYNLLAVFSILMLQGFELSQVLSVISMLQPVPGRMEVVHQRPLVVVDYAHTPDALANVLKTLKEFKQNTQGGRLWVVFGCGGDRDAQKRPIMGKIAAELADYVVVTSDNPRLEQADKIIEQIVKGMNLSRQMMKIEDRKLAIISALEEASIDDIILIAGKGHENYQLIGTEKFYFSDQDVVRQYLAN